MKKIWIALVLSAVSTASFAQVPCPKLLNSVKQGREVKVRITPENKSDIYKFARPALKHYRQTMFDIPAEASFWIESVSKYQLNGFAGPVVFGYKVDVADGGDESTISYYLNRDGKLIFGELHNQSPEYYWFCGK